MRRGIVGVGRYGTVEITDDVSGKSCVRKSVPLSYCQSLAAQATVKAVFRELLALTSLRNHRNVVELIAVKETPYEVSFILEKHDCSLDHLIRLSDDSFPRNIILQISGMIAAGLNACHSACIVHRDIKPGNILISVRTGIARICDFGLARRIPSLDETSFSSSFTNEVCTRWYKPIEVLLGATTHRPAIDIWSFGCVVAELHRLLPLFPGESDIHQLFLIQDCLGPVTAITWPSCAAECADFGKVTFQHLNHCGINSLLPGCSGDLIDIISESLEYNPVLRPSASKLVAKLEPLTPPQSDQLSIFFQSLLRDSSFLQ